MTLGSFLLGLVYYAVAFLCFTAWRRNHKSAPWLSLAVLVAVLGLVRQLNLQVWLTGQMHDEAIVGGWYDERRAQQLYFIRLVVIALAVSIAVVMVLLRKRMSELGLAFMGAMILPALLAVRAASHHGIDRILLTPVLGVPPAYGIEIFALALIAGRAWLSARRARRRIARVTGPIVARIDSVDPP